jgi:alkyldihydroxyacetonephosphate synthase
VPIYEDVENDVREEIMRNGGSISHHHGVGKIRKRFIKKTMSPMGIEFMHDLKETIDPKNVFAINNTIYRLEGEEEADIAHTNSYKNSQLKNKN